MNNKKVFTVKVDGCDLELAIKKPTAAIRVESTLKYNQAWRRAEETGSALKRNLDELAEKHGVWNDEKRRRVEALADEIRSGERKLLGGANSFDSKESAKNFAFSLRKLRREYLELNRAKDELYQYTAESYADKVRTNYMVSQCCVNNETGKLYWDSYDKYVEDSESEVGRLALEKYFELTFEDLEDVEGQLVENKFLMKYGYMDDKFRPIDPINKWLVDPESGKRIDENGFYLDNEGFRCDKDFNRINDKGEYEVPFKEFE